MSLLHKATRAGRMASRSIRAQPIALSISSLRNASKSTTIRSMANFTPSPHHQEPSSQEELQRIRDAADERRQYYKRRTIYNGIGFVTGMIAIWVIATSVDLPENPSKPAKMDSGRGKIGTGEIKDYHDLRLDDPQVNLGKEKKVVVQRLGEEAEENTDVVETGTSTVPTFPRLLEFDDLKTNSSSSSIKSDAEVATEYTLLGLGIRTVSFLGIQVYVVGTYVATDDITKLQHSLIKAIEPAATSLVAGEKENLRTQLLDPVAGEKIWDGILKSAGIRTLIRVVPVRDTDFGHMRDAYVRAVTAKAKTNPAEFQDEKFGESVNKLKTMFGKGNVPKKKELVLARNEQGVLCAWFDDGKHGAQRLGEVTDERISRALWMHYLTGKHVASEPMRKSVVEGLMEFVERPVGTVEAQVHV